MCGRDIVPFSFLLSIAILSNRPLSTIVVKLISIWHVSRDAKRRANSPERKRPRNGADRQLALRRTFWCVLQGLERDGQRTRAGILADVNDSRRDNVEPIQHRRIRLLDCFARHGESSFILRRLDPAKENREQGVKLTRHSRLIASAGRAGALLSTGCSAEVQIRNVRNVREGVLYILM